MDFRRTVAFAGLIAIAVVHSEAAFGADSHPAALPQAFYPVTDGVLAIAQLFPVDKPQTPMAEHAVAHVGHDKEVAAPIPYGAFTEHQKSEGAIDLSKPHFETVPVPEPATFAIAASSLLGVTFFRRRHYSERSIAAIFWLGFTLVAACIAFSILPLGVACFVAAVPSLFYLAALIWFGADVAASALLLAVVLFLNVALLGQAMANAML